MAEEHPQKYGLGAWGCVLKTSLWSAKSVLYCVSVSFGIPTVSTNVTHLKYLLVYVTWILRVLFMIYFHHTAIGFGFCLDVLYVSSWVKTYTSGLGQIDGSMSTLTAIDGVSGCLSAPRRAGHVSGVVARLSSEDSWDRLQSPASG